ncbi:MAG: type II toxin-antitoxin system HicA family toxin [Bacteroidales bacterium]|nr:type II toxin-antitoxin system HicA family toxin [Bacteroidales bacterium]
MKYSEIHKKLREAGCYIVRYGGRHPVWESPITGLQFETSYHDSEEARKGTLHNIKKKSGVKL